jgi:mono/diheme cytochrome c family protein
MFAFAMMWRICASVGVALLTGCSMAQTPFAPPVPTLVNQYGTPVPAVPTLDASQVARGKEIYQANCERCHGVNGVGAANWKVPDENLNFPPPPHNDEGHTWHHADRVLYQIIRDGIDKSVSPDSERQMPAYGDSLSDAGIFALIAYFKSLWTQEHREFQYLRTTEDIPPTPTPSSTSLK